MKKITDWLSTPYYFNPSIKFKFKISISIGMFVFLFLYIFKPFYLASFVDIVLQYTALIGFITFLGVFFILFIPPLFFKNYFNEDKWTIGRNLLLIITGIFITGSCLWYFGNLFKNLYTYNSISYLRYLTYTYLVGTLPVVSFIYLNEKNITKKRENNVLKIKKNKKQNEVIISKKLIKEITINSDNGKENITFQIDNLVYITSQGNYASFFLKNEKDLTEKILRVTLTKIANELEEYSNIIRCHKSYIVNINVINDISGNARGYLLKSDFIPIDIPVSRIFSKQSLQKLIIKNSHSSQIS